MKSHENWIKTALMLLALGLPNAAHPHAGHDHETTGGSTGTATTGETTGGTSGSGSEGTGGETAGMTSGSTTGEGTTGGIPGMGGTEGNTTAAVEETDVDDDGLLDWKEADGNTAIVGTADGSGRIFFVDLTGPSTATPPSLLLEGTTEHSSLQARNGRVYVTDFVSGTISVVDIASRSLLETIHACESDCGASEFNGADLLQAGGRRLYLWEVL